MRDENSGFNWKCGHNAAIFYLDFWVVPQDFECRWIADLKKSVESTQSLDLSIVIVQDIDLSKIPQFFRGVRVK